MTDSNLDGIAIVGMHGRFPGASNVEAFWENLVAGRETITFFTDAELEEAGLDPQSLRKQGAYVPARGVLENAECFDAAFFGIHPKEAEIMDPQQRVFLEACTEALERAGYDPARIEGSVGVYAGATFNTYYLSALHPRPELRELVGPEQVMLGNEKDYLATRVAYKLNLRGPAISLNTACSSSLVAVCQACQSLLTYQSDMALAGGVSVRSPQQQGYFFQEGYITSPDGHTRTFDEAAQGTVFSNGVTVVVLKRLEEAVEDGDQIYAVIKGSALNNDGAQRASFGAPGIEGQSEVISLAQAVADVDADMISYIEAHGTATPLGDPIEVAALTKAFRQSTNRKQFCALGALKSNVGHLDAAAGTAGLIKTALSLKHHTLVPTLHYKSPNPKMDLENSPFYVNDHLTEWKSEDGAPLRAGVSSFGTGGTNAHVVLEEAPAVEPGSESRPWQVLTLSAKTEEALEKATLNLATHLKENPEIDIADVAHTLQVGRSEFSERKVVVSESPQDAVNLLEKTDPKQVFSSKQMAKNPPVVFMFPGQGSQYAGMASELYASETVFRDIIDVCAEILKPVLDTDLRKVVFPEDSDKSEAEKLLRQTRFTQPALFCIEYALAQLWMSWGVKPAAMIGHSVGEYVAGCLSGVFALEDALILVARRAELVQAQLPGCMLALRMPEEDIVPLLNERLSIAAVNAPKSCVVSGPEDAIDEFRELLNSKKIDSLLLPTSHAFHSAMMDPVIEPFTELLRNTKLGSPEIPYVSNVTATWITEEQTTSPDYWAGHVRDTVRFADGLTELLKDPDRILLEVGPGRGLGQLTRQHPNREKTRQVLSSLGAPREAEYRDLHVALGRLWLAGVPIDWESYRGEERRLRVVLPTYPFARTRYLPTSPIVEETLNIPANLSSQPAETNTVFVSTTQTLENPKPATGVPEISRRDRLACEIRFLVEELSGTNLEGVDEGIDFLEIGLDSLLLTQAATLFKRKFGVPVSFRQLMESLGSIGSLANYLDEQLEPEAFAPEPTVSLSMIADSGLVSADSISLASDANSNAGLAHLLKQQIQSSQQLLEAIRKQPGSVPRPARAQKAKPSITTSAPVSGGHGPFRPTERGSSGKLSEDQQLWLEKFIDRYVKRTSESKRLTIQNRPGLADPRSSAGFKQIWKEIVYPIYTARSNGSKVWDVDGNEYVDFVMGFGASLFGHRPEFVTKAIKKQLELGFEIGPIQPIVGETAALFKELTQTERVAFCNTGSEAVLAAMRVARTVTGHDKIATFSGDYHGIFDEVLYRPINIEGEPGAAPIAPGIPRSSTSQLVVLEYGSPEALEWLQNNAGDLAAVMVEPVQSRRLDLQPRDFLHEVRRITNETETALIFDEVVTGFRLQMEGAQGHFGVKADIATYGKVVGGGLPIGVVAGKSKYLDALDGGQWQFEDDSFPEVGVTFFAGTFVRHPIIIATAKAVLEHLKKEGPDLQKKVAKRAESAAERIRKLLSQYDAPYNLTQFSSLVHLTVKPEAPYGSLIFHLLRERGIHTFENRLFVFTTAHKESDVDRLVDTMEQSLAELSRIGFIGPSTDPNSNDKFTDSRKIVEENCRNSENDLRIPSTDAQREIWLAIQWAPEITCAYNQIVAVEFSGPFDSDAIRLAVEDVVNSHQSLRCTFSEDGIWQNITASLEPSIELVDLSLAPEKEQAEKLRQIQDIESRKEFDLVSGPLFRVILIKTGSENFHLLLSAHHIVCDGWSYDVLLHNLSERYNARMGGMVDEGSEKPMQMAEYLDWLNEQAVTEGYAAAKNYWLEQYENPPSQVELPSDRPRSTKRSFEGARITREIDPEVFAGIKDVAKKNKCTAFTILMAAYAVQLHRLSGQADIVIGFPVAGQMLVGNKPLIGHCANVLPLRCRVNPEEAFTTFLDNMRGQVMDALEHPTITYGELIKELKLLRDASRPTLVNFLFNLDRISHDHLAFHNVSSQFSTIPKSRVNFDVFFNLLQSDNELTIECEFSTALFDRETVERWLESMDTMLASIVANPEESVGSLNVLPEDERRTMLVEWNDTVVDFPKEKTLPELISETAQRNPDKVALGFDGYELSYGKLELRANYLAKRLQEMEVGPGVLVGVCMERSMEMVIALLAILKAGGAYVPLDPAYPAERIRMILEDSKAPILLSETHLQQHLPKEPSRLICLDSKELSFEGESDVAPESFTTSQDLAYVIFTSGSTGRPKGVEITHRALNNFLDSMRREPGMAAEDVLLAVTTLSFDIAGLELWLPLTTGAKVVVAKRQVAMDGHQLAKEIEDRGVTLLQATPITWRILLETGWKGDTRMKALCGGEPLPKALAEALIPKCGELWNMYGPTETTIWSTCQRIQSSEAINVGRPIGNTQVYVVNSQFQPQPIGVPGELLIGGDGVARGYLNRLDLTNQVFVANPFDAAKSPLLYKTGDLAKWRPDGTLDCLGRLDFQVKVRGFRIELEEIETRLNEVPGIKQAVASVLEDQLIAYCVSDTGEPVDPSLCREKLLGQLPDYMVPAVYVHLEQLPLTPNGKIDRKSLPDPDGATAVSKTEYVEPRTKLENQLKTVWEDVLNTRPIGVHDNFFDLGGHSFLAVKLFAEIEKLTGQRLPLATLFTAATISSLARELGEGESSNENWSSLVAIQPNGVKPTLFCVHGAGGNILLYRDLAARLGPDQPLYGFQSKGLDGMAQPLRTVEEMADHYLEELREIQPNGPYFITGYCLGGLVAYQMARILAEEGEEVPLVGLLDTYNPAEAGKSSRFRILLQRSRFHVSNLSRLSPSEIGRYFKEKLRVAKDGEFANLMSVGTKKKTDSGRNGHGTSQEEAEDSQIQKINDAAAEIFQPKPYTGSITLFKPQINYDIFPDPQMGWGDLVEGHAEVVELPVNPHAMLVEPFVEHLADALRGRLEINAKADISELVNRN